MQNLLPMRLVLVGASTPVFAGDEVTGLANAFGPAPAGASNDLSEAGDAPSLTEAVCSPSMTAFTGVCLHRSSWRLLVRDWSEAGRSCRLVRLGGRGRVEDRSTPSTTAAEMFDRQLLPIRGAELLNLSSPHTCQTTHQTFLTSY